MENVRLGVVGLGWFGGVLTESARATSLFDVVSCFARSEESRQAFAAAARLWATADADLPELKLAREKSR